MYISIIIAAVLLLPVGNVLASSDSDFTGDNFKAYKSDRPAINEDFDPDESCHFDVYQLKCIPGANQECPEGFGNNDDSTCFPSTDCPKDYHWTEDDETGQCYPNDKGCEYDGYTFTEDKKGCVQYKMDCDLNENNPLCNGEERTDGITVCDEPDHPGYKFCKSD